MKRLALIICLLIPVLATAQQIIVGGTPSPPINLASNQTYQFLTIDGNNAKVNLVTGNGVSHVRIHKLLLKNTKGFAMLLNNCTDIIVDSTFFNNIGFGVYAQSGSKQIQVLACQFLDVNGIDKNFLGHAVQFNAVSGGGNRINLNRVENIRNITDTSSHPHDLLSLYQSNGIVGDSIQVNYNWIRGGQLVAWPTPGSTGDGIGLSDVGGNYQVARGNIEVNPGCAGIQVIANGLGGGKGIKAEYNTIYSKQTPVSTNAINVQNPIQMNVSNNTTNWTNFRGNNVLLADGETQYDYFNSPMPVGQSTNRWRNLAITPSVLPAIIITMAANVPISPPNITYTTPNTFTVGQSVSLSPTNSGGAAASYSGSVPIGLSLNTTSGVISGIPTTVSSATYTITATNSGGSGKTGVQITVNAKPIAVPIISYVTPQTYTQGTAITPIAPSNTGGAVVSYAIDKALPSGLSFNVSNGVISGTATVASSATVYTVTATNAGGSGKTTITITVNAAAIVPPNVSYLIKVVNGTYGYAIPKLQPVNTGGAIDSWGISPALSAGLSFTNGVVTGTPTSPHAVQTYVVTATNGGGSDTVHLTITVNKAMLTITAISMSKLQGQPNPALQAAYSGLVNGDTGIQSPPTISTTATTDSPVGTYVISLVGGSSANYNITLVDGILSVYGSVQVTGVHFGGIVPTP